MTDTRERAQQPEDLARLFVERGNAGDAEGLADLYEIDAVVGFPPGQVTTGREAIRALYEQMLATKPVFTLEAPLPRCAMATWRSPRRDRPDNTGVRAQVARRQPDGNLAADHRPPGDPRLGHHIELKRVT